MYRKILIVPMIMSIFIVMGYDSKASAKSQTHAEQNVTIPKDKVAEEIKEKSSNAIVTDALPSSKDTTASAPNAKAEKGSTTKKVKTAKKVAKTKKTKTAKKVTSKTKSKSRSYDDYLRSLGVNPAPKDVVIDKGKADGYIVND